MSRAFQQVGAYKAELEKDGWEFSINDSFLEIYDDTIRDLLREEGKEEGKHEIKVDEKGRRFVSELTMCPLDPNSEQEVEDVTRQSATHRSVACTDMKAVSFRSHSTPSSLSTSPRRTRGSSSASGANSTSSTSPAARGSTAAAPLERGPRRPWPSTRA